MLFDLNFHYCWLVLRNFSFSWGCMEVFHPIIIFFFEKFHINGVQIVSMLIFGEVFLVFLRLVILLTSSKRLSFITSLIWVRSFFQTSLTVCCSSLNSINVLLSPSFRAGKSEPSLIASSSTLKWKFLNLTMSFA